MGGVLRWIGAQRLRFILVRWGMEPNHINSHPTKHGVVKISFQGVGSLNTFGVGKPSLASMLNVVMYEDIFLIMSFVLVQELLIDLSS